MLGELEEVGKKGAGRREAWCDALWWGVRRVSGCWTGVWRVSGGWRSQHSWSRLRDGWDNCARDNNMMGARRHPATSGRESTATTWRAIE